MSRNRQRKNFAKEKSQKSFSDKQRIGEKLDSDKLPPLFSLEKLVVDGKGGYNNCQKEDLAAVFRTMYRLSQSNWREIKNAPRHGLGTEKIKSPKVKLPAGVDEDETILAIRYWDRKPMLGFRGEPPYERVFYILFIDRAFEVYNH